MGVHGSGDADVGVAEEFLDHDEFDALLQEEGRGRVAEVVEPDLAQVGLPQEGVEVSGEGGWFDRVAVESGEDVAAVHPGLFCFFLLLGLLLAVGSQCGDAGGGEGDAAFGADGLGGEGGQAAGGGALEGAADAGGAAFDPRPETTQKIAPVTITVHEPNDIPPLTGNQPAHSWSTQARRLQPDPETPPDSAARTSTRERVLTLLRTDPQRDWRTRDIAQTVEVEATAFDAFRKQMLRWSRQGMLCKTGPGTYKLAEPTPSP